MNFSIYSLQQENENLRSELRQCDSKINRKVFRLKIIENEALIAALKGLDTKPIISAMNYATKLLLCNPFDLKNEEFLKEIINEK